MATRTTQTVKPTVIGLSSGGATRVTQTVKVVIATVSSAGGNRDLLRGMI